MLTTMTVSLIVSRRVGQTTLASSRRTSPRKVVAARSCFGALTRDNAMLSFNGVFYHRKVYEGMERLIWRRYKGEGFDRGVLPCGKIDKLDTVMATKQKIRKAVIPAAGPRHYSLDLLARSFSRASHSGSSAGRAVHGSRRLV